MFTPPSWSRVRRSSSARRSASRGVNSPIVSSSRPASAIANRPSGVRWKLLRAISTDSSSRPSAFSSFTFQPARFSRASEAALAAARAACSASRMAASFSASWSATRLRSVSSASTSLLRFSISAASCSGRALAARASEAADWRRSIRRATRSSVAVMRPDHVLMSRSRPSRRAAACSRPRVMSVRRPRASISAVRASATIVRASASRVSSAASSSAGPSGAIMASVSLTMARSASARVRASPLVSRFMAARSEACASCETRLRASLSARWAGAMAWRRSRSFTSAV